MIEAGPSVATSALQLDPELEETEGLRSPDDEHARRLYLAHRRHELLAPVNSILELATELLHQPKIQECTQFHADLHQINKAAIALSALVERGMKPAPSGPDERGGEPFPSFSRKLKHDLRNLLAIIEGYSGELRITAQEYHLDGFAPELELIERLGGRCLGLIDEIVAQIDGSALEVAYVGPRGLVDPLRADRRARVSSPGRILIVDDDPDVRTIFEMLLSRLGHSVTKAADGEEALATLRTDPAAIDLILLDIVMSPRASGFRVLDELKSDHATRDIPVIMVSGLGEREGIVRCIEMGAEDYLPKPCDQVLLRARVDACLEKKRLRDDAERERRRFDELLHTILPGRIVQELKETDQVKPQRRDNVAVLFADIVGFTPYCDARQDRPEEIVGRLQRLFEAWEEVASGYRVQKIKTIGDAFMAASGLLEDSAEPVLDCVLCGLSMIRATHALGDGWDLRVGIHIGPVVAGVLGRRQYLYDLWGDTVNTAARLESHGKEGCVTLIEPAWGRVAPHFHGETRSLRLIKGKGDRPIELYHLDPLTIETKPTARDLGGR
jgi:adenylate cyclase